MAVETEENDTFAVLLYDDGDLYISRYPFAYTFAGYAPSGNYIIVDAFDAWDYENFQDDIDIIFDSFIERISKEWNGNNIQLYNLHNFVYGLF